MHMAKRKVLIEYRQLYELLIECDSAEDAKKIALESDWTSAPVIGSEAFVYDVLEEQAKEE